MGNNPLLLGTLITPLIGAILTLLFAKSNRLQRSLAVLTGLLAWVFSTALLAQVHDSGIQTYALGSWPPPYGIILVGDALGALFAFMVTAIMIGGLLYTFHSHDKCMSYPAFVPLFLLMEVGLVGAMFTGDLFTLFRLYGIDGAGFGVADSHIG